MRGWESNRISRDFDTPNLTKRNALRTFLLGSTRTHEERLNDTAEKLTPYQRKLFLFLGVATFFEGYDFMAITQILPNLRAEMGLDPSAAGYLVGFVNIGAILAYLVVRKADVWGRKRVLTITIIGYTVFTFLTALSPNVWAFAIFQLLARIFLLGEWAVSMVIAAEEFPAKKRATVIGVIQACSSLGAVICAGVVPFLLKTSYGWRSVYLVGVIPLVLLAFTRRGLRETERFTEHAATKTAEEKAETSLWDIWRSPYRNRMLVMASIWFVSYISAQNAVAFWKEFAVGERGFTDSEVGLALSLAAVVAMPFVFASGKLLDVVGRRRGAFVIYLLGAVGTYSSYTLHGFWPLTAAVVLGIMSASAFLPVLNSYTTEMFPTEFRGAGFAWSNNILGRVSYVLAPILVGFFAGQVGGFGPVVSLTAVFPLIAIVMVYTLLPETKDRELEATSNIAH